jgi:lipopolysaccharide transport protein LptA
MRNLGRIFAVLFFALTAGVALGQGSAPPTLSTRIKPAPAEKTPAEKPAPATSPLPTPKSTPASSPEKTSTEKKDKKSPAVPQEQIVTEIYADQAVFDSTKSIGVFTGNIVVTDPRFKIQGDKLTIYLSNKQSEGLDKAVVEGNVGVVRDRPRADGGPPDHMVGRSDKAVYTAKDGNFELTGNARVQQGLNTHVATSPDTVMILNEKGQLQTKGPSRTEIRQAPSPSPTATP